MKKQKEPRGAGAAAAAAQNAITDPRFASFATDPRFRLPSKKQSRTTVDKRFSRMLEDEDFANTAKVDRYGRKLNNNVQKQALRRLYQPEVDESGEDNQADVGVDDDEAVRKELRKANAEYDPARGGGFSSSDEEEENDDDDEEDEDGGAEVEDEVAEFPNLQEAQTSVPMGEVTSRIAVVNLDWDHIRAVDLMAVFASFVQTGGQIKRISVYPSEFGRERMEREETEGPRKELFGNRNVEEEDELDLGDESEDSEVVEEKIKKDLLKEDDGQDYDSAVLRQYQIERLRYYYAVIVCSDKATANQIYEATDGTEYLTSANFFDLRFVPDDVEFEEKPRDVCDSVPSGYRPADFVTDALQHSKVKLTWDAENTERKDAINRAFSGNGVEVGENDLTAYIGSDSSEEEMEADGQEITEQPRLTKKELARQKMRAALGFSDEAVTSILKPAKPALIGGLKVQFTPGFSNTKKGSVFVNQPITEEKMDGTKNEKADEKMDEKAEEKTGEKTEKKTDKTKKETTEEAYIRKEKERKARRREKAKARREGVTPKEKGETDAKVAKGTLAPEEADAMFGESFFTSEGVETEKPRKAQIKEARKAQREARQAAEKETAAERAKLELLMADDPRPGTSGSKATSHFDIKEIIRAEKEQKRSKKSKKGKKSAEQSQNEQADDSRKGLLQQDFQMDVRDPRFEALYERHEYAIDPSNAKFKATEGMKALLEEGRGRRKRKEKEGDGDGSGCGEEGKRSGKKVKVDGDGKSRKKGELKGLVESLKKRVGN